MMRRARGEVVMAYIPTGLRSWDENGGIHRGILTVIGAATGQGKSIVKLQLARGAAQSLHKVCMIDFEDPSAKTADRVFAGATGMDSKLIGLLNLEDFDVRRLDAAIAELSEWAGRIEYSLGLLSTERCLEIIRASDADIVLVDYAQAFPEDDGQSMERTIARFAWECNDIAQKRNIAIVIFSQIVRAVEERGYRTFERARFRNPEAMDVSGFCPGGLSDVAWAKSLGERAKELRYIWRENQIAAKLGARVKDDKLRIIAGKVNFGDERDMLFLFDGPTATIREWPKKA